MKTLKIRILALGFALGLLATAGAQPTNAPANDQTAAPTNAPAVTGQKPAPLPDDQAPAKPEAAPGDAKALPETKAGTPQEKTVSAPEQPMQTNAPAATAETKPAEPPMEVSPAPTHVVANGEKGLRLNFRNAPLEYVLNYLSEAAGFIIMPGGADVRGKVDVWSSQPLTKEEAIDVLNAVLAKNSYAAVRNGRILKIVTLSEMKTQESPVLVATNFTEIPKTDDVVTQIIPVKFISAVQLSKDLSPLTSSTMTANEGGNSLIVTDTQSHIRRIAEIVHALDNAISSVSAVRVFPLNFADAKSVASVIKELFASQQDTSQNRNQGGARGFFNLMRGGGGNQNEQPANGRAPTPKVVAVADEHSNAVVVSAPPDQMPVIADLVSQIDTNVVDITDLRVFPLKNADPQDIASQLATLFPDQTTSQQGIGMRGGFRFGGPFGGVNPTSSSADQSQRTLKQTRVVAVADPRTRSVIVLAARDLMEQIAGMIDELDTDPARKMKPFVIDVQNTDPAQMVTILQALFPSQTGSGYGASRSSQSQTGAGNQLNTRAQQNQNNYSRSSGTGNTGFGGTGTRPGQ